MTRLRIFREPTDRYGCVRCELYLDVGGHAYERTDYSLGKLYFRESHFDPFVSKLALGYDVSVKDVPSYEQMSGTERS